MGNDITIFSNEIDESTDVVIEWIKYYTNYETKHPLKASKKRPLCIMFKI